MSKDKLVRSDHLLFAKYPLDGTVEVDCEPLSTPYHIYNGEIFLIGGIADAAAAATLLQGERLAPLLDTDGNALMALWVCDFTEANLGPHHELQISLFASPQPRPPVQRHPFAIHRLLALNPDTYMVCHGLWNNTARVVRYNQAHLGLDAHLSVSQIQYEDRGPHWVFCVDDVESGQPVAEGSLGAVARQPAAAVFKAGVPSRLCTAERRRPFCLSTPTAAAGMKRPHALFAVVKTQACRVPARSLAQPTHPCALRPRSPLLLT